MKYTEGSKSMFIDSEFMAVTNPVVIVLLEAVMHFHKILAIVLTKLWAMSIAKATKCNPRKVSGARS